MLSAAVPNPENTEDEITLLCSPNDKVNRRQRKKIKL